jgi:arylsulfatase A-like enzyme
VAFERAYANVPVCGASRASLLTGLHPTRERFTTYYSRADEDAPDVPTLPEYFRLQGFHTAGIGKVFHDRDDSPASWSVPLWTPLDQPGNPSSTWRNYLDPESDALHAAQRDEGPLYERAAVPDTAYYDGQIAYEAARRLAAYADGDGPFFLAVGFVKPHLPFNAPARYWDLHPAESITLPEHRAMPLYAPREAWDVHSWGELETYSRSTGLPEQRAGPLPDTLALKLVQGYRAATSYVDAQIGHVLDALEQEGLAENTVVVLFGDHGFSLSEHGLWGKHSTFEVSMRVPLLVRAPGVAPGRADAVVSLLDLYPTLVDLVGIPRPDHLDGQTLVPLLRQPRMVWTGTAFGRYIDAETVRTDRYRYSTWTTDADSLVAHMLYDHDADPLETVSLADRAEGGAAVERLQRLLADWRADRAE